MSGDRPVRIAFRQIKNLLTLLSIVSIGFVLEVTGTSCPLLTITYHGGRGSDCGLSLSRDRRERFAYSTL